MVEIFQEDEKDPADHYLKHTEYSPAGALIVLVTA